MFAPGPIADCLVICTLNISRQRTLKFHKMKMRTKLRIITAKQTSQRKAIAKMGAIAALHAVKRKSIIGTRSNLCIYSVPISRCSNGTGTVPVLGAFGGTVSVKNAC
jgi:hypothetical protein